MEKEAMTKTRECTPLLFPYRGIIWGGVGLFAFCVTRGNPVLFVCGTGLICAGEALRIWGVGYIRNYRGPMREAKALVTGGPYAYVRNPLYLANAVIGCGIALLTGVWWILLLFCVVYVLLYGRIIREEESYLARRFPGEYRQYAASVPRILPRRTPYPRRRGSFSWLVIPKKEVHTFATIALIVGAFYLRSFTGLRAFVDRVLF
ncbi:MAG TPA: isoprenylcysteine carboxylmethyltransferase family protein [Atribacteraceae bacterium]|nr:isoprenylcysteine carboxylmethyltransferase family protein [Atribacteraceae bacterium]